MPSSPIVPLRDTAHATHHVLCFHHAGGAAVAFREWPKQLPEHVNVWALVLPGRERRFGEPFHDHLDTAADELADALERQWNDLTRVTLFGHSLGGLTAFEVARRLHERNRDVHELIISGVSPETERDDRYNWTDERLISFMKELGGTPEEVFEHPELLAMMLPVLRADLKLVDTYSPAGRAALDVPMSAIGGLKDSHLDVERLSNWQNWANADFERKLFDGGHFYLDEQRDEVLAWLAARLTQA